MIDETIDRYLNEAKKPFEVYHDTYTSAVQGALDYAKKQGYETNDDETFTLIGQGPSKPSVGKTNKLHIPLYKGGKLQRKVLHFQVYNRDVQRSKQGVVIGNDYELNAYIS